MAKEARWVRRRCRVDVRNLCKADVAAQRRTISRLATSASDNFTVNELSLCSVTVMLDLMQRTLTSRRLLPPCRAAWIDEAWKWGFGSAADDAAKQARVWCFRHASVSRRPSTYLYRFRSRVPSRREHSIRNIDLVVTSSQLMPGFARHDIADGTEPC